MVQFVRYGCDLNRTSWEKSEQSTKAPLRELAVANSDFIFLFMPAKGKYTQHARWAFSAKCNFALNSGYCNSLLLEKLLVYMSKLTPGSQVEPDLLFMIYNHLLCNHARSVFDVC